MIKIGTNLRDIRFKIWQSKGFVFIAGLALFLFSASVVGVQGTQGNRDEEVLGIKSKAVLSTTNPIPKTVPSKVPTSVVNPSLTPSPTRALTPTVAPTSTPTQSPTTTNNNSSTSNTPTSTPMPTPTSILTPMPSPTPAKLNIQIAVDYAGKKSNDSYSVAIDPGQTAWDAVVAAIGIGNISYTDYGGDLGYFITAFNGISADSNQYFEFRVNGVSSNIGVSGYKCNDGDKLDFVLTSF